MEILLASHLVRVLLADLTDGGVSDGTWLDVYACARDSCGGRDRLAPRGR